MKKNDLIGKVQSYMVWTGSLLAANIAKGQIVYTDVNPDVTVSNNAGLYALDLNNDGTIDFNLKEKKINSSSNFLQGVMAYPLNNNAIGGVQYGGSGTYVGKPFAFNQNMSIDNTTTWNNLTPNVLAYKVTGTSSFLFGDWVGKTDKYLPLRIQVAGQTYYGWARLDVAPDAGSFTIKDYAYNATPNAAILAGDNGGVPVLANMEAAVLTYNTGSPALPITAAITASDVNDVNLDSAMVKITSNFNAAEDSLVFSTQNGITGSYNSATGKLMLSGTSSVANYQAALRSVKYVNTNPNAASSTRDIVFTVNDGTANSNTQTRTVNIVNVFGIEESAFTAYRLYPNPSREFVSVSNQQNAALSIAVYDLEGKLLLEERSGEKEIRLNVSGLSAGVYVVQVSDGKQASRQKLVKE